MAQSLAAADAAAPREGRAVQPQASVRAKQPYPRRRAAELDNSAMGDFQKAGKYPIGELAPRRDRMIQKGACVLAIERDR